jgi:hypothetical protein
MTSLSDFINPDNNQKLEQKHVIDAEGYLLGKKGYRYREIVCCTKCKITDCPKRQSKGICLIWMRNGVFLRKSEWLHS